MSRPKPLGLWIGLGAAAAVTLAAFLLPQSSGMLPVNSQLNPNLGVVDKDGLKGLTIHTQEDHPVTPEMDAAAKSLNAKKAPPFRLKSTDGKEYSLAELTNGKPLVMFFIEKDCPCCLGAKYFVDRITSMYRDSANVIGIINAEGKVADAWVQTTQPKFMILEDPDQIVIEGYAAERGVYTTVVSPSGTIDKAYAGYSLEMLRDVSNRVAKLANIPAKPFNSKAAPTKLTSGCLFPAKQKLLDAK